MKTKEQIKEYLEKQSWYPAFKEHCEQAWKDCEGKNDLLDGYCLESTIFLAFPWGETYEGYEFWNDINEKFIKWFDN